MKKTLLFAPLLLAGCLEEPAAQPTSDQTQQRATEQLAQQANRVVGTPSIVNFFEKSMVRTLYEMRDNPEFRTYSYIVTMAGKYVKICDSIGFGINASIQFSNPVKLSAKAYASSSGASYGPTYTPQAEPNGLFMPEGLAATYVLCLDPSTVGTDAPDITPVYVEPEVIVSPFPLTE